MLVVLVVASFFLYQAFKVEVPPRKIAVLIKKWYGPDLPTHMEIAPAPEAPDDVEYKGVQLAVLKEGRAFYNPYTWEWEIYDQVEVPQGKVGVVIRLFGDDLPHQQILAREPNQKGILPGVLLAGRYPQYSNPYAYKVLIEDAVTVPAGFKGVVTLLTGTESKDPNKLLVNEGERGVQTKALDAKDHYVNRYEQRISLVDCRTKKLNLAEEQDMGFPSADGFWIRLDGTVQFHVIPEKAAEVFVTYNDDTNGDEIEEEIIQKVILPNARSFCRLAGSSYTGRQFIEGKAREEFQKAFQTKMVEECEPKGISIDAALITKIYPPQLIAEPVRQREIAKQEQTQYTQEIMQQNSEAMLKVEQMLIEQKKRLVEAEQEVIEIKTKAEQEQKVAVTEAEKELAVAKERLEAARDQAAAVLAKGKAEAEVIRFNNEAEVSGQRASVTAYNGNGYLYAQQVLFEKLAPSFQQIMANSSDSPIMRIFEKFHDVPQVSAPAASGQTVPTATPEGQNQ